MRARKLDGIGTQHRKDLCVGKKGDFAGETCLVIWVSGKKSWQCGEFGFSAELCRNDATSVKRLFMLSRCSRLGQV
jgi:hypothetical protein